jgi:hypothetical protein
MKRPAIIVGGVLSLAAIVTGVVLITEAARCYEGVGPPPEPRLHGLGTRQQHEVLPLPPKPGLLSEEERVRAAEFLRRLPPRQRRQAVLEFRERMARIMETRPPMFFPWPLVLLFLGSLGLAVTLFLIVRRWDPVVRLERCPHCGRPVEAGWSFCPYCTKPLGGESGSDR